MLGSDILEIALGLVLIYLLMSLILTAAHELVENFLKTRASTLEKAITELLGGDPALLKQFYDHPLIYALYSGSYDPAGGRGSALPSYIPRETFAAVLLDLADKAEGPGKARLADLLGGFDRVAPAGGGRLRREIEGWFDGAMDRASGWYKRNTQLRLFCIALAVSLLLNINSIAIANYLAVSPQQRQVVAALAQQAAQPEGGGASLSQAERTELQGELDKLGIPIGWKNAEWRDLWGGIPSFGWPPHPGATLDGVVTTLNLLLGYLITAFALTLGAPFWFDILNRIMVIRATVKPKEKSPDEPSEDGGKDDSKAPPAAPKT
ncbi:MAG TPA: hypothetical protein VGW34_12320 [Allosphingosinicella sp.]|nr:hypothetical protein [Allosphingosinicella sp.]